MSKLFDRIKLRPSQLRTVANRRFGDAKALCDTKKNERANGAIYLGGFVIECLLKAKMLEQNQWLSNVVDVSKLSRQDREIYNLCFRHHDLGGLLEKLPDLQKKLQAEDQNHSRQFSRYDMLRKIMGEWTIYIRYSPQMAIIKDAENFVERVKELKEWLR